MKFSDLISKLFTSDELNLIQGIEKKLRSRRKSERNGIYFFVATLLFGMIRELAGADVFQWSYLTNFRDFIGFVIKGRWAQASLYVPIPELAVILIFLLVLLFYFLLLRTRFLKIESEEPFRYTFWVDSFEEVKDTPPKAIYTLDRNDRFNLLHHDLMERLNSRIKRLSLLNLNGLTSENTKSGPAYFESIRDLQSKLIAHIQIGGTYSVREEKDNDWVIHVMPQVRIGSMESPSILAYSVKFPLEKDNKLNAGQYNQFIERVYSSVATEVYKQIELDVHEKMKLFPTSRLRALALFNEAEDFARSNTIDAYDRAITLYREALRYFEISQIRPITQFLIRSIFWRLKVKPVYLQAKIQIGFIKCLIYRRITSALTGRYSNPIFEIRPIVGEMLDQLEKLHKHLHIKSWGPLQSFFTFPKDSWIRHKLRFIKPSESSFEKRSQILFDAYVVAALGYFYLGSYYQAPRYLKTAKSVNPKLSDRNPLFLLAAGLIEPDLDESILLFRQATEIAPDFQIAQYILAEKSDMLFRMKNEISASRVVSVTKEYDKVLNINPGNIAALAAQGYLWWLVGDLHTARKKFEEGIELKSIATDTFVGQLSYGLARIAAEEGRFNNSYDLFHQAISADPGIGTQTQTSSTNATYTLYYDQIVPKILERYDKFKISVNHHYDRQILGIAFLAEDLKDPIGLAVKLKATKDDKDSIQLYLREQLSDRTKKLLEEMDGCGQVTDELRNALVEVLNKVLKCKTFYDKTRFSEVVLSEEAYRLIRQNPQDEELVRLNRLLLEEIFPGQLIRHEDVSKRTINTVLSYVLNDFGNACLGYYARFGDVSCLEQAITNYGTAIKLDNENVIVYFNQYLGYLWKGAGDKNSNSIEEVLLKYPKQQAIVFTLAQSILREPEEIREKKKELEEHKRRTIEIRKPEKQIESTGEMPRIGSAEKVSRRRQLKPTIDRKPRKKLEEELKMLEKSWSKSVVRVKDLSIENSKFSSLFDPSRIKSETFESELNELNRFFSKNKIASERLNENDVRALKVLCYYLLTTEKFKINDPRITRFYDNILNLFWPEDFDIDTIFESYKQTLDAPLIERRKSYLNYWLKQDPVNYSTFTWLEPKYFENSMTDDMRMQLKRAGNEILGLDLKNAYYWNGRANVYYNFREYAEAADNYLKAIELDANAAVYHSNLGRAYNGVKDFEKAIEAFKRATALDSGNTSYINYLGNAYYDAKDFRNAMVNYKNAIEINPDVAVYHSNLGLANYELKDWGNAIGAFRKATELDTENAVYFNDLGNAYYNKGDYENASENYKEAIAIDSKIAAYHANIIAAFEKRGDSVQSENLYKRALSERPDDSTFLYDLGNALYQNQQWKKAIQSFTKAVALSPNNAGFFNSLGNANYKAGDYASASQNYLKAIEFAPDLAVYHSNLGLANYALFDWEKAKEGFTKAIELDMGNANSFNDLGNVYYNLGDFLNASENYKKAIAIDSKVAVFHANIIAAFVRKGDPVQSDNLYKDALNEKPGDANFLYELGTTLYQNQQWMKSIQSFEKAIDLDSTNSLFHNDLGTAYNAVLDYQKAAEHFLNAFELNPVNDTYLQNLINAVNLIGLPADAISLIEKAMLTDPNNTRLKNALMELKG